MAKMTSAYASKLIKKLNEDKEYWRSKEREGNCYIAAADEEPVIPSYDYRMVFDKIAEIDGQILKIKHAVNINNTTNRIEVGNTDMSIDEILVKMAQLNQRKMVLDSFRKMEPKTRVSSGVYNTKKTVPEYQYINFDPKQVAADYEQIDSEIAAMQIALDRYNQTVEIDVEI